MIMTIYIVYTLPGNGQCSTRQCTAHLITLCTPDFAVAPKWPMPQDRLVQWPTVAKGCEVAIATCMHGCTGATKCLRLHPSTARCGLAAVMPNRSSLGHNIKHL